MLRPCPAQPARPPAGWRDPEGGIHLGCPDYLRDTNLLLLWLERAGAFAWTPNHTFELMLPDGRRRVSTAGRR